MIDEHGASSASESVKYFDLIAFIAQLGCSVLDFPIISNI